MSGCSVSIKEITKLMKADAPKVATSSCDMRNAVLKLVAEKLVENKEAIFAANAQDMKAAEESDVAPAVLKRLKFTEAKLNDVVCGIKQLITLPDPVGRIQLERELDEDLKLYRVSCPIGVIGIIFEARPDALVQIASLCLKSGNCAVIKGGRETAATNKKLFEIIHGAAVEAGMPQYCLYQAELHSEIDELLSCSGYVDLLIPRGSNSFVKYIMEHTQIPVMGHTDGICHIYVDEDYDKAKAVPVIVDAKTQYTAACNSVETILVNRKIAKEFLTELAKELVANHVVIRGTSEVSDIIGCDVMEEDEFNTEYLDLKVSVKCVDDVSEAISHINRFGSHHTDCIITENSDTAKVFMTMVDSAGVYQNCSTRFADGFRYGFGAEVGISTAKLHARGPVGLEGLVTYKYNLYGNGNIVGDYASGKKCFKFRDC